MEQITCGFVHVMLFIETTHCWRWAVKVEQEVKGGNHGSFVPEQPHASLFSWHVSVTELGHFQYGLLLHTRLVCHFGLQAGMQHCCLYIIDDVECLIQCRHWYECCPLVPAGFGQNHSFTVRTKYN